MQDSNFESRGRSVRSAMPRWARALTAAALGVAVAVQAADLIDARSAGAFTVFRGDAKALSEPAPALSERQLELFMVGRAQFNRPWVVFGVSAGDWGVGPTFNATSCAGCHPGAGRGAPPVNAKAPLAATLVRLSLPGAGPRGGPRPDERYGDQIQNQALQGQSIELLHSYAPVPAEAQVYLDWEETKVTLADGATVNLRKPKPRIEQLAFGPLAADTLLSVRHSPPIFGLGLFEAVPEETILQVAQHQRELGLNGRPNYVWDEINRRQALGRFGWKATQPSLRQQIAAAAINDIGATSSLFPRQNCPDIQQLCRAEVPGNDPELTDAAWDNLELWVLGLGVPARRNWGDAEVKRGAVVFEKAQCAGCHLPTLSTAEQFSRLPQLAKQTFHPYTDLLLHDMGDGLADHRPDFAAGGRDWRTPPLWGIGLSQTVSGSRALLHDGRARNLTEAILWHGGEAQSARDAFRKLGKADRDALLKFLEAI